MNGAQCVDRVKDFECECHPGYTGTVTDCTCLTWMYPSGTVKDTWCSTYMQDKKEQN